MDQASGVFAVAVPPITTPGTVNLPKLPGGLSPGSVVITLLAGLGAYLQTQPRPQPDPVERAKQVKAQEAEDNKRVVKMKDVSSEIDKALTSAILAPLIYRAIVNTLSPGRVAKNFTDLTQTVSDAEFDPIRSALKEAIRKHLLQQSNKRKVIAGHPYERLGDLHLRQIGPARKHPGEEQVPTGVA